MACGSGVGDSSWGPIAGAARGGVAGEQVGAVGAECPLRSSTPTWAAPLGQQAVPTPWGSLLVLFRGVPAARLLHDDSLWDLGNSPSLDRFMQPAFYPRISRGCGAAVGQMISAPLWPS